MLLWVEGGGATSVTTSIESLLELLGPILPE